MTTILRIATRKSKLALWQANHVKSLLEKKYPSFIISLVEMITEGDKQQTMPLADIGGKALFVKALQNALLNNTADIAVHSIKDMSVYDTADLTLGAILQREDARDAFISNHYQSIDALPLGATVGTSSPRRASLIKALRSDVDIKLLRGNVDTRLAKLDAGEYDAIVLAAAGLIRLGLSSRITDYFSVDFFTPAIGQGAIAVECRSNDHITRELLQFLNHEETTRCVNAERAVNKIIGGDCHTPIGAHAVITNNQLQLSAMLDNGKTLLRANLIGDKDEGQKTAVQVAEKLMQR